MTEIPWWLSEIKEGVPLSKVQEKYGKEKTPQNDVENSHAKRLQKLASMSNAQLLKFYNNLRKFGGKESADSWELSAIQKIVTDRGLN